MKYILILLSFILLSCEWKQNKENKRPLQEPICEKGTMQEVGYEYGISTAIPAIKNLKNEFTILVDTTQKATNFISDHEAGLRITLKNNNTVEDLLKEIEETTFISEEDSIFLTLSKEKQNEFLQQMHIRAKLKADSIHQANNQGKQLVWLINNSLDTVFVQVDSRYFIMIMEALVFSQGLIDG